MAAKKDLNTSEVVKWASLIASIVFFSGMALAAIKNNSEDISCNRASINGLEEDVSSFDVMQQRLKTIEGDIQIIKQAVLK